MKDQQNWWQISTIQIGSVICLPVFMIGYTLSQNYGFISAVVSILVGNAILLLLGMTTAKMSHSNRKTTMENAELYFGSKGILFFAFTMMLSLLGWFGIQLNMMSLGVIDLLSIHENKENWLLGLNLALGGLMTFVALQGIRGVTFLANLSMPLLLLTIGYAAYTVEPSEIKNSTPFSLGGTSMVIALAIAMVIDLPTYYRFAKTAKDGLLSIALIFGVVLPLLEIVGVYLSTGNQSGNILDVLKRDNSTLWNLWIAAFLILAGWTTNNVNLYSSSKCLQSIVKNLSEQKSVLFVGVMGTFSSCFNLLEHLEIVLDIMGVLIASMGSVVLTRYLGMQHFDTKPSFSEYSICLKAWTAGIAIGFIGMLGYSLTAIALLDAVLGASLSVIFFKLASTLYPKELHEKVEY